MIVLRIECDSLVSFFGYLNDIGRKDSCYDTVDDCREASKVASK